MGTAKIDFIGAKLALFVGERLAVILRDDRPGLLWPGYWDLPGGGREDNETPLACVLRETHEELSLVVPPAQIRWARPFTSSIGKPAWFMVGWLPAQAESRIVLGSEGQRWALMSKDRFLRDPKVVPQFQTRLQSYLDGTPSAGLGGGKLNKTPRQNQAGGGDGSVNDQPARE